MPPQVGEIYSIDVYKRQVGSGQAAPDKTELAAAIAAAEEIDRTLYTKTTAAEFVAAYESAVAVNESEDADQAAIDRCV